MKRCIKCHKEYPATTEYFYKDRGYADGLRGECKMCTREYGKRYCKEHRKEACERAVRYRGEHPERAMKYYKEHRREYHEYSVKYYMERHKTIKGYLHGVYHNICRRCNNQADKAYKNYGGRGIKCLFKSFDDFYSYVVNVLKVDPRDLDTHRIDNDKGYEPGNIMFLSRSEHIKLHKEKRV